MTRTNRTLDAAKEDDMMKIATLLLALFSLSAFAAGKFTLESGELKPNQKIVKDVPYDCS